jgi:hypothetical protein
MVLNSLPLLDINNKKGIYMQITFGEAIQLLESKGVKRAGEIDIDDKTIKESESRLGVQLPKTFQRFLKKFGCIVRDDLVLLGLGVKPFMLPHVESAFTLTHAHNADAPLSWVPIHLIERGIFACLDCSSQNAEPPVILWNINLPVSAQNNPLLANSFADYFGKVISDHIWRENAILKLEEHVNTLATSNNYSHAEGGKLPRNHIWRPYRFCVQDVLLGATVVQHVKGDNFLKVDVFLTEVVPPYEPDSGVKGLTLFLLCEAYKCGGTMEIRFTENMEGGRVPQKIQELADRLCVPIPEKSLSSRRLSPHDSRALFAALTPFPPEALARISELDISIERACYVVQKGIWSLQEAETILLSGTNPDRLFSGGTPAEQRLLYLQDLLYGRMALLGGCLDRVLSYPLHESSDTNLEVEDNERPVKIKWEPSSCMKIYVCETAPSELRSSFKLPWGVEGSEVLLEFSFGEQIAVVVRARDAIDLCENIKQDLHSAIELKRMKNIPTFILYPFDFYDTNFIEAKQRLDFVADANKSSIGLLICPETSLSLDSQVQQRFNSSRIIRE